MRACRVATREELEGAIHRYGPDYAPRFLRARGLIPPMMGAAGLAIDASTPAYVYSTSGGTTTTASFTPPVGSLLVAMFANGFSTTLPGKPTNTGATVSWAASAAITEAANSCSASIWLGTVTASAASTVSQTASGAGDIGMGIAVVTGQAASPNGLTGTSTSASGTPSAAIASLIGSNSLILGTIANFSGSTIGTPDTNQTLTFNGHAFSGNDVASGAASWAQYDTRISLAAGASDTINDTAPTGIAYSMVALEILAADTGPPPPVSTTNLYAHSRMRAKAL